MIWTILYILGAYLVGAVPFGYLAGKCNGIDLREHGSCNIGATNAWRVLGKQWGLPVFIMDFLKGFLPVLGAMTWMPGWCGVEGWMADLGVVLTCFAVVLGHTYTCFLGFKGGKGVATTAGVLFALNWVVACWALGAWLVLMLATGIVSLGSIIAAVAMIVSGWFNYELLAADGSVCSQVLYIGFFSLIGLLVIVKHRSNIVRLIQGTESSFYSKKSK